MVYRVICDSITDDPLAATATTDLPPIGEPYLAGTSSADLGATCRRIEADQDPDNPKRWDVTVTYESPDPFGGNQSAFRVPDALAWPQGDRLSQSGGTSGTQSRGDETEANPLLRPPTYDWSVIKYQEFFTADALGNPVINTAGLQFREQLTRDRTSLRLIVSKNERDFDPRRVLRFTDTVNDGTVTFGRYKFERGEVKCDSITASSQWENGQFFYAHRYEFLICPWKNGYAKGRVLVGTEEIDAGEPYSAFAIDVLNLSTLALGDNGSVYLIREDNGTPVTNPQPIDPDGKPISQHDPEFESKLTWLRFFPYREEDFSELADSSD